MLLELVVLELLLLVLLQGLLSFWGGDDGGEGW